MPVFDFKCTKCDAREEHIVLASEKTPSTCAECGGKLKRVFGGARVHINLQGWGFSKTDALISDKSGPRRDFKQLRERAQRMVEE